MTEAGYSRLQTDNPEVYAGRAYASPNGAKLADVSTPSWGRDLGLRFLQVTDLFFRSIFAFFIIELPSRRVIHVGVTRFPTNEWTAQHLREATPYGQTPKYLIRDHDSKFGPCLARVAATSSIKILQTPYHAPRANAICERFLGSVRRECLDHILILSEKQLHRVLRAYVEYFNRARPHQGIQQQIPELPVSSAPLHNQRDKVIALPVLGGLHHDYRRVA